MHKLQRPWQGTPVLSADLTLHFERLHSRITLYIVMFLTLTVRTIQFVSGWLVSWAGNFFFFFTSVTWACQSWLGQTAPSNALTDTAVTNENLYRNVMKAGLLELYWSNALPPWSPKTKLPLKGQPKNAPYHGACDHQSLCRSRNWWGDMALGVPKKF